VKPGTDLRLRDIVGEVDRLLWSAMSAPRGFTYRVDGTGTVEILHHGRHATTLRGGAVTRFLVDVETGDPQLLMARVTGAYKHGNERVARQHPRNTGGR